MRLVFDNDYQYCDYVVDGDQLDTTQALESAVLSQVLSDAQAAPNVEIRDGSGDRRGWCVDDIDPDGNKIGSLLWISYGGKATPSLRRTVARDMEASLAVFVDAGLASRGVAQVQTLNPGILGVTLFLYEPEDPNTVIAKIWVEVRGINNAVPTP